LKAQGKNPFQLDSRPPSISLENYIYNESRYTMLQQAHPGIAKELLAKAQQDVADRWKTYERWANAPVS
jgi:pyruvate-ferredoxin/flavodoxin oxidoreductase